MIYLKDIKRDFEVTDEDIDNMKSIGELLYKYSDEYEEQILLFINKRFAQLRMNKEFINKLKEIIKRWYGLFLNEELTNDYISKLKNICRAYINYNRGQDIVNSLLSFSRSFLHEKMFQNINDDLKRKEHLITLHKFLDVNLEILNMTYLELKINEYSKEYKFRGYIVGIGEKFSFLMQIILISLLILITAIATVTLFSEFMSFSIDKSHEFLISFLGSLLILWILTELIRTEVQLIKGGEFRLSIFIGVALIAYIRDLLILTLQHKMIDVSTIYVLSAIFILGFIYWLIYRTETIKRSGSEL
ncbi:MAG: phosphate-starvation-inducible PsiE family protein [Deferribacterota bacterium]|nr:phosphate-starvation-inducible PsiE family protein [Deferribacterota bacterium]